MKLTKLVAAPGRAYKVPPRAFRRFAAARTASQLIPGVRPTRRVRALASVTRQEARSLGLFCLLGIMPACGVPADRARAREGIHRATFLAGYSEFRGEIDGTDDGYVVMSYLVPAGVPTPATLPSIREQVMRLDPCYRVSQQTDVLLVLRCPGGRPRGGYQWDEEYRFLLAPKARRVYVQVLDSVKRPRYAEFTRALQEFEER